MHTFFLDLASHNGSVACVDHVVRVLMPADRRIADHELQPLVEKALAEAGWTWDDVDRVACVTGPGGFMSLRVAVSFCNALSWLRQIPIAGLHLSDLYHGRVETSDSDVSTVHDVIWFHSTKKQEVFVRGFGKHAALWPEATHLSLEAAVSAVPAGAMIIGELLDDHKKALLAKSAIFAELQPLEVVLPGFLAGLTYGERQLTPWYGREG